MLAACGGGGGGGLSLSQPSTAQTQQADLLFQGLSTSQNLTDIGYVVDTDSGQISLFSNRQAVDGFLAKQPDQSQFKTRHQISDLARAVFIPASLSAVGDSAGHGKFLLWGRGLTQIPPAFSQNSPLNYNMHASYLCRRCAATSGALTGSLSLDLTTRHAILRLSGGQMTLSQQWRMTDTAQLIPLGRQNASLSEADSRRDIRQFTGAGGLFGTQAEAAGLVFTLDFLKNNQVHQLHGITLGERIR